VTTLAHAFGWAVIATIACTIAGIPQALSEPARHRKWWHAPAHGLAGFAIVGAFAGIVGGAIWLVTR
jgi:hypothetical protein